MDDEGFSDPPTETTGHDRGTHRRFGMIAAIVLSLLIWVVIIHLASRVW